MTLEHPKRNAPTTSRDSRVAKYAPAGTLKNNFFHLRNRRQNGTDNHLGSVYPIRC